LRALQPLLAGLPRTDQTFTWGDQVERIAVAAPRKMLIFGGVGGALMVIGGLIGLADSLAEGHAGVRLLVPVFVIAFGALLAGYFFAMVRFKARLARDGS